MRASAPRLVAPMHYDTDAVNFLDPPDAFLDALGVPVLRPESSEADLEEALGQSAEPTVLLLEPPLA